MDDGGVRAMKDIPFTQYLLPNGRKTSVVIGMPEDVADTALSLIKQGYRFECEMLSDYETVSLTVVDPDDTGDIAIEVIKNGPEVPPAVERLVAKAMLAARSKP